MENNIQQGEEHHLAGNEEILATLVNSGFLSFKDVGRFLLMTSKALKSSFLAACGDAPEPNSPNDPIWKSILVTHSSQEEVELMLQATGLSPTTCAHEIVFSIIKPFELRALKYSPSDYAVVVSIRINNNSSKPIIIKTIPGDMIPDFFDKGTGTVLLDNPSIIETDTFEMQHKIHIVRLTDKRTLKLADCQGTWMRREAPDRGGEIMWVRNEIRSENNPCPMSQKYGRAILKEYVDNEHDRTRAKLRLQGELSEEGEPMVTGFSLFGVFPSTHEDIESLDLEAEDLQAIKSGEVTFAHFLEALDWSAC